MISRSSTTTATAVSPWAGAGAAAAGAPLGAVALDSTLGRRAHPTNMVVRTRAETVVAWNSVLMVWTVLSQSRLAREVESALCDGPTSGRSAVPAHFGKKTTGPQPPSKPIVLSDRLRDLVKFSTRRGLPCCIRLERAG